MPMWIYDFSVIRLRESVDSVGVIIYVREASARCPFNSDGQFQSLYAMNGQQVRPSRILLYNHK